MRTWPPWTPAGGPSWPRRPKPTSLPRTWAPVRALRRVFVHPPARAEAAASARRLKLERARGDLERLERGLGSRHYPDQGKAEARIAVIASQRRVSAYLHARAGTCPATGKPTLTWDFDQPAIDAEAATDGWYALRSGE